MRAQQDSGSMFKDAIVNQLRDAVMARGGKGGIRSLGRIFRLMDDNRNRQLSWQELQSGMQDYGVPMSPADCKILITALDRSGSGVSVSFDDFLVAMRGPMNKNREKLVQMAFRVADKDNSGILDFKDIAQSYDASNHPDVQAGRKSPEDIFTEFLGKWERRGVTDGKVTYEEFLQYYQDVSASIDNDQYFELMMRNAWHMSGGKGAAANTSNLRVLVVFVDGSSQIVEITDDLGLDKTDARAIRSKLRRQGFSNIAKVRTSF
jgi:Ca2+-binding EF-hand superfamily protein